MFVKTQSKYLAYIKHLYGFYLVVIIYFNGNDICTLYNTIDSQLMGLLT